MKKHLLVILTVFILLFTAGCSTDNTANSTPDANKGTGSIAFKANGEDFVRQGFVSKDGWDISFDHVYITLAEISAYQTDPPYDPHQHQSIESDISIPLVGKYTVDLAEGDENADTILVGQVEAPEGFYNAISWQIAKADSGETAGNSLVLLGQACKDETTLPFQIKFDREYQYYAGEYIGDERKGILESGAAADLEMTFHFDHIFGDAELPADDGLNLAALGFDPFAALAADGEVNLDISDIEDGFSQKDLDKLENEVLPTLGHVGEGHAFCEEL